MKSEVFTVQGGYIELIQLLKAIGIAETGGYAKYLVDEGVVMRNGQIEMRKRAKLIPGDVISVNDQTIILE